MLKHAQLTAQENHLDKCMNVGNASPSVASTLTNSSWLFPLGLCSLYIPDKVSSTENTLVSSSFNLYWGI